MFVNAWLDQPGQEPGTFPSGGAIARNFAVWREEAPEIDFHAPDIYDADFAARCREFAVPNNPLFVPETGVMHAMGHIELRDDVLAARAFYILGEHRALGISPFGFDTGDDLPALTAAYQTLRELWPRLSAPDTRVRALLGLGDAPQTVAFGDIHLEMHPRGEGAFLLALEEAPNTFLLAGASCALWFKDASGRETDFLRVESGDFHDGGWRTERVLNGDDTWAHGLYFEATAGLRCVELFHF